MPTTCSPSSRRRPPRWRAKRAASAAPLLTCARRTLALNRARRRARSPRKSSGSDAGYLRQVIFLTDGEIGNEQQLFETISAMRGRSRVFMVGIGSAPNSFLMTRAAELGRGAFTHIGSVEQVEERMRLLLAKLE